MSRIVLTTILLALAVPVLAGDYGLDPGRETDTVRFESAAKLEFIEGRTEEISGKFSVDPENTATGVSGRLQVDLRNIETGIGLRNRHLRENHLHTDQFPYAYFELTQVNGLPSQLAAGHTVPATASGNFYIHGGYRQITADLEVTRLEEGDGGGGIRIRARFSLNLEEFNIERPKALFLKVAETIKLDLVFTGYAGKPGVEISLPDWPRLN